MYFKNIIDAVGYTPLIELQRTSPSQKVKIMVKLEGQNPGGSASIKDRVAKYMIEKAEQSGALTRDKTIVEATSGNTGIALAWLGRQKGYKVTIVMPDSMSMERRQLLKINGAELILTKGALGMGAAIAKASEMAAKDKKYFMPDQFSNPANPLAHYETTAVEILNDFPYDKIDVLVVGIGTGGTIMGIARRLKEKYPNIKVIGVEPPPGDEIQGLKCLGEALPPFWDKALITEKTRVSNQQATEAASQMLNKEGIFTGISSGAVAHQAVKAAAEIGEGNIVAILADAGWKYLSLDFWNK
ncbi:MAG: cysteine synthase family protein [Dehalococcoidales bacterium]|jgi:cysteine synthase B|nr:cysteine synthase family protein [Dehalococcoidales bacterium]